MEWFTTDCGKYRIESLSAATFPGAIEAIRTAFCKDEAVCQGTEVNINPLAAEELLELCADAALDGVSLVAVETASGEVASVAFNKLQVANTTEKPFFEVFSEERCTQESSKALIQFMADVDGRCNLFEKYGVDCSLEIMFLATLEAHRRKNLGKILCKTSIELARRLKNGPVSKISIEDLGTKYSNMSPRAAISQYPKICQAIWTSEYSRKVGKSINFKVHLVVPFTELIYKGKSYTERIGNDKAFCEVAAFPLY